MHIFHDMGCHVMAHSAHPSTGPSSLSALSHTHAVTFSPESQPKSSQVVLAAAKGDGVWLGKGYGGGRQLDLPLPTLFFFFPSGPSLLLSTTPERRPAAFFILSQTSPLTV
jgi:hypothetical protein